MSVPQQPRPEVGDILVVIHDFQARSSDELTLAKGDRVELLERDDEFGDGWFLGKHMVSSNTGLFPEVYTRPAPKGFPTGATALAVAKLGSLSSVPDSTGSTDQKETSPTLTSSSQHGISPPADQPVPVLQTPATGPPTIPSTLASPNIISSSSKSVTSSEVPTSVALTNSQLVVSDSIPVSAIAAPSFKGLQMASGTGTSYASRLSTGHDSQVLHETLNVIDEHITGMRSPSGGNSGLHGTGDSGSEYSSQMDHRMSYIQGEETDEEEDSLHTRAEVELWNADDVAEYLFTAGVEKQHCEVFRDQEITGEVLLGMDQATLFIKAFELGPVGRRLKTWQKIKALQDEVDGQGLPASASSHRKSQTYGSDAGSEDARRPVRSRTSTITSSSNFPTLQQRLPHINDRPLSMHSKRLSLNQTPKMDAAQLASPVSPISPTHGLVELSVVPPTSPAKGILHEKRPSAASVRDLHHSRRHSSADYRLPGALPSTQSTAPRFTSSGTFPVTEPEQQHKKHPSFDRNWTLGNAATHTQSHIPILPLQSRQPQPSNIHSRPLSSTGIQNVAINSDVSHVSGRASGVDGSSADIDRGYFSSTDTDYHRKPYLQKKQRDSVLKPTRMEVPPSPASYTDEQRVRSATALSRQSRFGSVDSVRDPISTSPAVQKFYGTPESGDSVPHRRTASNTADSSITPIISTKDSLSPTVTRRNDSGTETNTANEKTRPTPASPALVSPNRNASHGDWFSTKPGFIPPAFSLRALSDAVTGHERTKMTSPSLRTDSFTKDSPLQSPSRTDSSTPSAGPSFELDSPDGRSPSTAATAGSARTNPARKKGKKETSAYQRGLQKVSPREAAQDADYSGWMKKRSSNLMATWKPRLFVLKGRRLAYYYSENDDQEKGLIDISFHRVLPADNERLTGLHATLTGVSNTPAVPTNSNMPTLASAEASAEPDPTLKASDLPDSIFIFKLVPPRAGLSRAVNFTKPMVHYFAVPNIKQGRLWMAALMKATIDRDDTVAITTTYQQKTISLAKARQMRHRPPALMNLDEKLEDGVKRTGHEEQQNDSDYDTKQLPAENEGKMLPEALAVTNAGQGDKATNGLGITYDEKDSGVLMEDKQEKSTPQKVESARTRQFVFEPEDEDRLPLSA